MTWDKVSIEMPYLCCYWWRGEKAWARGNLIQHSPKPPETAEKTSKKEICTMACQLTRHNPTLVKTSTTYTQATYLLCQLSILQRMLTLGVL
jgi:hypothetical protein